MPAFRLFGNHRYRISQAQRTRNFHHKKWWLQWFPRFTTSDISNATYTNAVTVTSST